MEQKQNIKQECIRHDRTASHVRAVRQDLQRVDYILPNGETIELLSEMRIANYDFGDFDETVEELRSAYLKAEDKETKESLERRMELQRDAFADFLGIQSEEIQNMIGFSGLSTEIKETLLKHIS